MMKSGRIMLITIRHGQIMKRPAILLISWKEVQTMREKPLKKNSRFYLGMVLNVVEGMLSGFNFLLLYEAMKMLWNGTINSPLCSGFLCF